jgi:hypothetical protein
MRTYVRVAAFAGLIMLITACNRQGDVKTEAEPVVAGPKNVHSQEHLSAFEAQCMESKNNSTYCSCSLAAFGEHLQPQHIETDESGKVSVAPTISEEARARTAAAIKACEDEHIAAVVRHSDEVINTLTKQCMESANHKEYCKCSIAAMHEHVPADQIVSSEGLSTISPQASEEVTLAISGAMSACKAKHMVDDT